MGRSESVRCKLCSFWSRSGFGLAAWGGMAGFCKNNPPTVGKNGASIWPITMEDDWCGQFDFNAEQESDENETE